MWFFPIPQNQVNFFHVLTSHLQRLTLIILSSGLCIEAATDWGYIWVRCAERGGAHGQLGDWQGRHPQWLMGGLPDGVYKAVSGIYIPLICSIPSLACCSPRTTVHPQIVYFMTQSSRWGENKWAFLGSVLQSWGNQVLNHTLSLSPMICGH